MSKLILCILILLALPIATAQEHQQSINAAQSVLDDFMREFNNRDLPELAKTLNYPHVRFASDTVQVFSTPDEFSERPIYTSLIASGWDHSHWLAREVVLASTKKIHIATTFSRFDQNNEVIGTYQSLYVVTMIDGHWGIQARSSLAP
tara:strand:- start:202 stop:645 length:444 start_codon:yes stop_codon:yes gene_type:complete